MKNLVIGSVFALAASQAAGCIIESDDSCPAGYVEDVDGTCILDGGADYATVGATWQIRSVSGQNLGCPTGFNTAALFNVAVDGNGTPLAPCTGPGSRSDTCFVDLFNCEDGAGVSAPLPPRMYQTWVAITTDSGAQTYATSLSAYLDVRDVDLDFNATIFDDGGYFAVDWTLQNAGGGATTCAAANVPFVGTTISSGTNMYDSGDPWACEDGYGVTSVLAEGTYNVIVEAVDANNAQLGKAPDFPNETIQGPNLVTDLGTANIVID